MSGKVTESDLYERVRKSLRKKYPKREGWEIKEQPDYGGYRPDFIVERKRGKTIQRVIIEVKTGPRVSKDHVMQVNKYAQKLAGGNVSIRGKEFYVPAGTNADEAKKAGFQVHYLRVDC